MFIDHPVPAIWETAGKETDVSSGLQVDLEEERGKAVLLMGNVIRGEKDQIFQGRTAPAHFPKRTFCSSFEQGSAPSISLGVVGRLP